VTERQCDWISAVSHFSVLTSSEIIVLTAKLISIECTYMSTVSDGRNRENVVVHKLNKYSIKHGSFST
jgi:hypothetical protein